MALPRLRWPSALLPRIIVRLLRSSSNSPCSRLSQPRIRQAVDHQPRPPAVGGGKIARSGCAGTEALHHQGYLGCPTVRRRLGAATTGLAERPLPAFADSQVVAIPTGRLRTGKVMPTPLARLYSRCARPAFPLDYRGGRHGWRVTKIKRRAPDSLSLCPNGAIPPRMSGT